MADLDPLRKSIWLLPYEEEFFRLRGWTQNEILLLRESSSSLYDRAQDLLNSKAFKKMNERKRGK